ncbi:MAG: hypothetical protein HQ538_01370 [Parcubacteria group bacterium]|nr:hypothetical protein [Parcubacteria group bacterium]
MTTGQIIFLSIMGIICLIGFVWVCISGRKSGCSNALLRDAMFDRLNNHKKGEKYE